MEYFLAIKRKEGLIYPITWINLDNITLSESSQSKKTHYLFYLYKSYRTGKHTEGDSCLPRVGMLGILAGETANGSRVSCGADEDDLKLIMALGCTTLWMN